jgi:sec-independent protein translocase protein TatC
VDQEHAKEMSFLDHLEELRKHLIRSIVAVLAMTFIAFFFMDKIFHYIIMAPSRNDFITFQVLCDYFSYCIQPMQFKLISRTMTGQFTMHLLASFIVGLVVSFPYVVYELWRFVAPALHVNERKNVGGVVVFISVLFFIGVLFGYYLVSPMAINFLANYQIDPSIENAFDVTSYISTLCLMAVGGGVMFQLPVVVYLLTIMGLMTPAFMREYRRHAIVVIFVIAAILTPSPDILSQVLMGVPMIILYELSIFVSKYVYNKKLKQAQNPENDGY